MADRLMGEEAPMDPQSITRWLRASGSDLMEAKAFRGPSRLALLRWLRPRIASAEQEISCGFAQNVSGFVVVLAERTGRLRLTDRSAVEVSLSTGYRRPSVVLRDGLGEVRLLPVHGGRAEIPSNLVHPVTIQLVAVGPSGPQPLAMRTIDDGPGVASASSDLAEAWTPPSMPRVSEQTDEIYRWLASFRDVRETSGLRRNSLLERAAGSHAAAVCAEGRARHYFVDGPEDRVSSQGLTARHVGEVVARAPSASQCLEALVRSPSHYVALVDVRFTDVGVGLHREQSESGTEMTCVVILFAAWPRYTGY
ncbi:MAG: CAP domain-containing protein [Myxococcota bacterium]